MANAHSIEANLSVSQKEEILEILVNRAGGSMVYSSTGMAAGYFFPGDKVATRFTGKENLNDIANKAKIDISSIPHEETKLGGLGKLQNINNLWNVMNDAIVSAPRKQHGYVEMASHILSSLTENGFQLAIPVGSGELIEDVLRTPLIKKHLVKTFEQRYTSKATEGLTKAILSSLETMGVAIDHKSTARMSKLKDAYRNDSSSPYKVTVRTSLDDFFVRTAELLSEQNASPRVFINTLHRAAAKRNLTFTLSESHGSLWLPVDYMPPQVKMTLVDIYSSFKQRDVESARHRLNEIKIFERPPYHSYQANNYQSIIAERIEGRFHGYVNQISSQLALAKGIEKAQEVSINELKDSALELFEKGNDFVDVMKSLAIVELASKPALYSTNVKNAHHALNLTGNDITALINGQTFASDLVASRNKAESFVVEMRGKLKGVVDASENSQIGQRINTVFDNTFDVNSKMRLGVREEHAYSLATADLEQVLSDLSQDALQAIKARLKRVGSDLEQYVSLEKDQSWLGVLNGAKAASPLTGDYATRIAELERIIVINELLDTFEKEIYPEFSNRIKQKALEETKVEPVADVVEPVADVVEPVADVVEPVADVAEPVADVAEPVADDAEPAVDKAEPNSVSNMENELSDALRKQLRELENTLTDIPFNNEMDLVLADEFDWLNRKWAEVVPASIDDEELPQVLNLASNVFSRLAERPHRKNMKEWFLHSVELDSKAKEIEMALGSLGQTPGAELMRRVVKTEIAHLYFTPTIVNENASLSQFEKAAFDVKQRVKSDSLLKSYEKLADSVELLEKKIEDEPEHSMQWKVHLQRCSEMTDMASPKGVMQLADKLESSMNSDDTVKFILEQPVPSFSGGEGLFNPSYSPMEDYASVYAPNEEVDYDLVPRQKIA